MKRRSFLLGGAALLAGGAAALRPRDHGAPYNDYFRQLNAELKAHGPMRPSLLIDLDRLDHNIEVVKAFMVKSGKHYRIVEKSLPSAPLIEYIAQRCGTRRLMSFHQPFLNHDAQYFPDADLLLGKPLPVRSAALFYEQLKGGFDPARQLQWLLDTPQRLQQYLELAQGLNTRLRVNIEIDVGLHRGGVRDAQTLQQMLSLIAAHPQQLQFAGFMGYDPHIVAIPALVASRETLLARSLTIYQERVALVRREFPQLWQDSLTLNSAGSPTYQLHGEEQISNEVSIGTGLLKPSHYDLDTLAAHMPAVYIATPVLKATGAIELPGLDEKSRLISWWDVNQRQTYFIYGGNWMAEYEAPAGLQFNASFGHSSNQEIVNASPAAGLRVEDQVFLRPTVTEEVLLEFGDLLALRGGRIVERWPVFRG
ncbi:D-serine deaminase, pyridoxal phosphate-dependent [Solimonas aquatica]|uniref:D-serine deaminase, pyridoxal phosphate-dependent n=1 Tax=Solimonas aquatica TaxID=489703 RepID=A0A1H9KKM1_9GAMM|nr:DSD1 family PLP-dependent enzyme [Solimonas aquatica]SEQ99465.1 D-serine deaminase, pyridoxal phosphate-dependent [Solimonas aquatica]